MHTSGEPEFELVVDRLAVGGDGIAREPDGRVVFVEGALPGERVAVRVTARGKDFWRARTIEVLESNPARRPAPCPEVARGCGGCGWMHVEPSAQAALKTEIVRDALARQGRLPDAQVHPVGSIAAEHYRTSARFAAGEDGSLGFRRASSNRVLPVETCLVLHPGLEEILRTARVTPGAELSVRVSVSSGERTAAVMAGRNARSRERLRVEGLPASVRTGIDAWLTERVGTTDLRVSAGSFFQSSPRSAELLVSAVGRALRVEGQPVRRWVDLYGGIGLFAAMLMPGTEVTVVEQSGSACRDARENLLNREPGGARVVGARVVESKVEDWVPEPGNGAIDAVVADPARSGLGRGGAAAVARTASPVVVLVSCDAASLGRDTALLGGLGYEHAGSEVLDLFPNTPHVEVVTRFVRGARGPGRGTGG